jgi:sarcosine oxidase subunit gamma
MRNRVLDSCSILRVQTWDAAIAAPASVEQVLGISWPRETGAVVHGRADIICTGPAEWWVICSDPHPAALLGQLEDAFAGSSFRATNVSEALVRIEVEGPQARMLLAKGCALDLHPSCFPAGRCARTRFAGMPVIVCCTQEATFECIVASSYRDYLISWLVDAAKEFSGALA